MTTAFCIEELDQILFSRNIQVGIIAQTRDDAKNIFKDKLKFSFDNLDPRIRAHFRLIGDSADELSLAHGSVMRVGTSLRSSTLQKLHISEFGKICAKYPEKAREIITGSLNTVHEGSCITIESTAEGKEGYFYDLCQSAMAMRGKKLSHLDWKFYFFPWYRHPEYEHYESCDIPDYLQEYFDKLALDGINLTKYQQWWYVKKEAVQRENMLREYPSTPEEAFSASQEGYWYSREMRELHDAGHVCNISHDRAIPVHVGWDLGQADFMALWFFQINRSGEINFIDYWQGSDTRIDQISQILQTKGYTYASHILPHDANARDRAGATFVQQARSFGIAGYVLEPSSIRDGINLVRSTLSRCWFDSKKCATGIRCLENYKKKWSPSIGGWTSEPEHDEYSHGADAFRYVCLGLPRVKSSSNTLETDYKALNQFWR